MREPHFGTIKQLWETYHEGTFKELKETYYEGSPLWVFYSDQVELKLEILSELEFDQLNPKLDSGHHLQTNIVNVMFMMGQTLARRSMQNPEQHWKSSDVSLARPVSFAPLSAIIEDYDRMIRIILLTTISCTHSFRHCPFFSIHVNLSFLRPIFHICMISYS